MFRSTMALGLVSLFAVCTLAQDDIQRGTIKKVDAGKGVLTITVKGEDKDFLVTPDTKLMQGNQNISDGLKNKSFRLGAVVIFKAFEKDRRMILLGLRIGDGSGKPVGISRGVIKQIDVQEGKITVTITADGKDMDFLLTDSTLILDFPKKPIRELLKDKSFVPGAKVMFKTAMRDGKDVLIGLKFGDAPDRGPLVKFDTSKLKPLPELGTDKYHGFQGGLYPEGKNQRPSAHEAAGLARAKQIVPLDDEGKPSQKGMIVMISVGMSNTTNVFSTFKKMADADRDKSLKVMIVDCAQGGMSAGRIVDPNDGGSGQKYWAETDRRIRAHYCSTAQVQVAWIKEADPGPDQGFPEYAKTLQTRLARIVQVLHSRYPNIKIVYLSSRTYAGYARTKLNPEPYAYESGFSVKWLIEDQIKGETEL
ncbi:MAG TPA: hypothetical protein VKE98_01630, partial [Gemmataceae bacterium]|nr:hypothetical protein [Gemmataceae bacterium]